MHGATVMIWRPTRNSVPFLFEGNRIYGTETPQELHVKDGDVIQVR